MLTAAVVAAAAVEDRHMNNVDGDSPEMNTADDDWDDMEGEEDAVDQEDQVVADHIQVQDNDDVHNTAVADVVVAVRRQRRSEWRD